MTVVTTDATGAVVTFPAPTSQGPCGLIACSPASGTRFPVGATVVTCTSDSGASCQFTITVELPVACLANPVCGSLPLCSFTCGPPSGNVFVVTLTPLTPCMAPAGTGTVVTSVQTAVNLASSNDTIMVCPGTYVEPAGIVIPAGKNNLTLQSFGVRTAILQRNFMLPNAPCGAIVLVNGAQCTTIRDFTISGPGPSSLNACPMAVPPQPANFFGIGVIGNGSAVIDNNHITAIHDSPTFGSLVRGRAISVTAGQVRITNNDIDEYQRLGIFLDGTSTCGEILDNRVMGNTSAVAVNVAEIGLQIGRGARAIVRGNVISANTLDRSDVKDVSTGILLVGSVPICILENRIEGNNVGISLIQDNLPPFNPTSGVQITRNLITGGVVTPAGAGGIGIMIDAASIGNTISLNQLAANPTFDMVDLSVGAGSCGTGNAYLCNTCESDDHGGCLCSSQTPSSPATPETPPAVAPLFDIEPPN